MPNFNRTGPQGQGPMTGRKRGRCIETKKEQTENSAEPSAENKEVVYGLGCGGKPCGGGLGNGGGKGQGRGRGRGFGSK